MLSLSPCLIQRVALARPSAPGPPRPPADGFLGAAGLSPCTLGGPLSFGGGVLARDLPLPDLSPEDLVLIRDTGASTLSMWSRHCSRGILAVLGVDGDDLRVLRERERPEDVVAFWSRGRGQP